MDTKSIKNESEITSGKPSRLPAGSTLELANGIHVPHPHAEVNLPGAGDSRAAGNAVTETLAEMSAAVAQPPPDESRVAVVIDEPLSDRDKVK